MATFSITQPCAFGIIPGIRQKLRGFPAGRIRIRQRSDDFVRVFVKTSSEMHGYFVRHVGESIMPGERFGFNQTVPA